VRIGSNLTLRVIAESPSPLQYQWRFNGTDLPGANDSALLITNLQIAHEGRYTVIVSNAIAAAESDPANIVALSPTVFLQPPLSQSVVVNGNVTFSAVIAGHPAPFLFRWRTSGSTLTNFVQTERTNFFTLENVQTNQAGGYFLLVTNLATASAVASFTLTVLADTDNDGMADTWETNYGLNPTNSDDRTLDFDLDGLPNWREYIAGTNPTNQQSNLKLSADVIPAGVRLTFDAQSNHTYSVQSTDNLSSNWVKLADIVATSTNRSVIMTNVPITRTSFYRLVTPRTP
jgi:hypothetical protein